MKISLQNLRFTLSMTHYYVGKPDVRKKEQNTREYVFLSLLIYKRDEKHCITSLLLTHY